MACPLLHRAFSCLLLGGMLAGCQAYRNRHDGQHLVARKKHAPPSKLTRTVQAEVTTGPDGAVADVHIVRSSGSPTVDEFVVESMRANWPGGPAQRSLVELTHSAAEGFSEPKVLSSAPTQ